jgi:hypothetical protein
MKTKLYAALVACVAIAGLLSVNPQAAVAEEDCGGGGTICTITADGAHYYTKLGQVQVTQ